MTTIGHLFEDVTASYHPPGVAEEIAAQSRSAEQHRRDEFHRLHDVRPVVDSRHIGVLPGVGHGHFAFSGPDDFNEYVYPYAQLSWAGYPATVPTPFRQHFNMDERRFDARSIGHLKILHSFSKDNPLTQWVYLRMSRGVVQDMPIHSLNVQEWLSKGTGARVHRCSGALPHRY